jgi:hypothetical protein
MNKLQNYLRNSIFTEFQGRKEKKVIIANRKSTDDGVGEKRQNGVVFVTLRCLRIPSKYLFTGFSEVLYFFCIPFLQLSIPFTSFLGPIEPIT